MYPLQMRKKVLRIKVEEKASIRKLAKRFGISPTTLFKWTKAIEVKTTRRKKATKINMESLKKDIEENPDIAKAI